MSIAAPRRTRERTPTPRDVARQADKMPPHNLDAERETLSAVLLDPSIFPAVRKVIDGPDDFFRDAHGVVYRALCRLADSGRPLEPIALEAELRVQNQWTRIDGPITLEAILTAAPHAANGVYHAGIIAELAARRRLIQLAGDILEKGYSDQLRETAALASHFRASLAALAVPTSRAEYTPQLTTLSDVEPQPIDWLWPNRIPRGGITLIAGDPSAGKSFLTLELAATVTTGRAWPDLEGQRSPIGDVIFLSAEDHLANTIRPRADAAGADVARIHNLRTVKLRSGKFAPVRLHDVGPLEAALDAKPETALIVIDPISAYLSGRDEHKNAEVRELLSPLADLAERRNIAVVLVTHLNKGNGSKAIYRSLGSLAFGAAARFNWLVIRDKVDRNRRKLLPSKINPIQDPPGLAYTIADGRIVWDPTPLVEHADDALAEEGRQPREGQRGPIPAKARSCADFLKARLKLGPVRHGVLRKAAEQAEYSASVFYRAVELIGAYPFEDDQGKKWIRLTPAAEAAETEADDQIEERTETLPF